MMSKAIMLLVLLAVASVSAKTLFEIKAMASLQSTAEYQMSHGNEAALERFFEEHFSVDDQTSFIHAFIHTSDAALLQLGAKQTSIDAFRKNTADWSLPTWEDVKKKVIAVGKDAADWVSAAVSKKIAEIKETWALAKGIAKDIWNGNWCGLCDKTTNAIGKYFVDNLTIEADTMEKLVCKVSGMAFGKACAVVFKGLATTVTIATGGVAIASLKVADAICWVLAKLNSFACEKYYAPAIVAKIPADLKKLVGKVFKNIQAVNKAVETAVMSLAGAQGPICKDALKLCDAKGNTV